jgi:hypothetical protein
MTQTGSRHEIDGRIRRMAGFCHRSSYRQHLAGLFYCADRESAEGGQIINGELRPRQSQEVSRDVWRAIKRRRRASATTSSGTATTCPCHTLAHRAQLINTIPHGATRMAVHATVERPDGAAQGLAVLDGDF